jgi:uncharacterized RDD family membrane protein YckC
VICSACGANNADGSAVCSLCSAPLAGRNAPAFAAADAPRYAGFWLRVLASLIDATLIGALAQTFERLIAEFGVEPPNSETVDLTSLWPLAVVLLGRLIYFVLMESSKYQGTVGKIAMGIKVTDLNGDRVSFQRALGRYLASVFSDLTLGFGFAMAGFTRRRQALHDKMAGTLVVRRGNLSAVG